VCDLGWGDCDGVSNACETPLNTNPHCTDCNLACAGNQNNHTIGDCSSGTCLQACEAGSGWRDCDDDMGNGCEIDTSSHPDHCGGCHRECRDTEVCCLGVCTETYEGTESDCGGCGLPCDEFDVYCCQGQCVLIYPGIDCINGSCDIGQCSGEKAYARCSEFNSCK
jgi:hypothetical protein